MYSEFLPRSFRQGDKERDKGDIYRETWQAMKNHAVISGESGDTMLNAEEVGTEPGLLYVCFWLRE
jgi:hypothetical protein